MEERCCWCGAIIHDLDDDNAPPPVKDDPAFEDMVAASLRDPSIGNEIKAGNALLQSLAPKAKT